MKFSSCKFSDELFEHVDGDNTRRLFNVTLLNTYAKGRFPVYVSEFAPDLVSYIKESCGVEESKINRLVEPYLSQPISAVTWFDGKSVIVDGHHRLVKLAELGRKEFKYYMLPLGQWEQFVVEDVPRGFGFFSIEEGGLWKPPHKN